MHLVQPIVASVVEGSTHHGHCNRRVRPTSDRKRKFGVNKLFTAVNGDKYQYDKRSSEPTRIKERENKVYQV